MQSTSATWKRLCEDENAWLHTVAVINGVEYDEISNPLISRSSMQNGLSIGNVVSASCNFSIRTDDDIPRSAKVQIKMRFTDGNDTSEWIPAGTFYISHRNKDVVTGLVSLECYDSLLMANVDAPRIMPLLTYNGSALVTSNDELICTTLNYPIPMDEFVSNYVTSMLGVEIDPRTQIASGESYMVVEPEEGTTVHDILAQIASANGGNWIITPNNKLRLVPVVPGLDTVASVDIVGVVGSAEATNSEQISGIRYVVDDKTYIIGDDTGFVLDADTNEYAARALASWIVGRTYTPYNIIGAIYDPAIEIGDMINYHDNVQGVLYNENVTLGLAFRGDISAPEPGEISDEYPYIGATERTFKRIDKTLATKASIEYVDLGDTRSLEVIEALNDALDQEGIFNRLTNNGETQGVYLKDGKLYINGTYIDTGILNADLLRVGIITDASGQNYWILDGANSEFVTRKGIIGDFLLEDGSLQYGSLNVGGTGAYIGRNGVVYNRYLSDIDSTSKVETYAQGVNYYWNGIIRKKLYINGSTLALRSYDDQGNFDYPLTVYDSTTKDFYVRYNLINEKDLVVLGRITANGKITFLGDLEVRGTKNRCVDTEDYGKRLLYAYETASPMFGDVGEGVIGEDGRCYVWLDSVFSETISTDKYQVFLQRYGAGDCWVSDRKSSHFIIEGTPGLNFGWEIKAKQFDYAQRRLETADDTISKDERDYGEYAIQYIEKLKEGRIPT